MHRLSCAGAFGKALVVRPQDDSVISGDSPSVRRVGLIADHRSISIFPTAGADPPVNSRLELDRESDSDVREGCDYGHGQRPRESSRQIFVTPDGRRARPRLSVEVQAAGFIRVARAVTRGISA